MKKSILIFVIFLPILCFAQVKDDFSDGDFTHNPTWAGADQNFFINSNFQIQSCAQDASVSYLFTPSEAIDNATWLVDVKINYNPSAQNYSCVYLISDVSRVDTCNAYYVQIGGTNDEVSLYLQQGARKTKIIDGFDKRTDTSAVEISIKVTRDIDGNFALYSRLKKETDYFLEGRTKNTKVTRGKYVGLMYRNSKTTGYAYFFDNVDVEGEKAIDIEPPEWISLSIVEPNKLFLQFSEEMNFENASYEIFPRETFLASSVATNDGMGITLEFYNAFETNTLYTLYVYGLTDLAGNELTNNFRSAGLSMQIESGDLVWNEVMFHNPENSIEYIEVCNKSDKLLDISGLRFTTLKSDGSYNSAITIPEQVYIKPHDYAAFCSDADMLKTYYNLSDDVPIYSTKWITLNNESATLVLLDENGENVFDQFTYSSKWHHPLVKSKVGVSLEKINPDMPTQDADSWHSASSVTNYGTPGYQNSQYRDLSSDKMEEKVWIEPEYFSPDNDGVLDVCFIYYSTEFVGSVANAIIFNSVGEKIVQLCNGLLLSSEGYVIWDGKTDAGKIVNTGVYILYFQLFNPLTGKNHTFKLPIVVSAK